jgi:DNA/RNA endonuclease YhcR with UshA esterase domain
LGQPLINDCNCPALPSPAPAEIVSAETITPTTEADAFTPPLTATLTISAPTTSPPTPVELLISWEEAGAYAGQTLTVEGQVVDTYNSGKVVFLNFAEDFRTTFKVVIFPDAWPLFPTPPEEYYRDKTIQVTGQIEIYQNAPEIIVAGPDQIEIVE